MDILFLSATAQNTYWQTRQGDLYHLQGNKARVIEKSISASLNYGGKGFDATSQYIAYIKAGTLYFKDSQSREKAPIRVDRGLIANPIIDEKNTCLYYLKQLDHECGIFRYQYHKNTSQKLYTASRITNLARSVDGQFLAWIESETMVWITSQLKIMKLITDQDLVIKRVFQEPKLPLSVNRFFGICFSKHNSKLYLIGGDKTDYQLWKTNPGQHSTCLYRSKHPLAKIPWHTGQSQIAIGDNEHSIYLIESIDLCDYLIKISLAPPHTNERINAAPYSALSEPIIHQNGLYCLANSPSAPSTLIAFDQKNELKPIYRHEKPSSDALLPEYVQIKSQDYLYPALFYRSKNANGRVLIKLHGGPAAHYQMRYSSLNHHLNEKGISILEINPPGSSGASISFMDALQQKWGIFERDILQSAIDYLQNKEHIDPTKLYFFGQSAAGYSLLFFLSQCKKRYAGAIIVSGAFNPETLKKDLHPYEHPYLDWLKPTPPLKADLKSLQTPLLLLHGKSDRIIHPNQSIELFEQLPSVIKKQSTLQILTTDHNLLHHQDDFFDTMTSFMN